MLEPLTYIGVALGASLAAWGFFHQLIVGGAVTLLKDVEEQSGRLMVMSWVAQGAFMSFLGILPASLLLIHGLLAPAVKTVLFFNSCALLFLSGHVIFTGYATHIKPIRIGAFLELINGLYLLALIILF